MSFGRKGFVLISSVLLILFVIITSFLFFPKIATAPTGLSNEMNEEECPACPGEGALDNPCPENPFTGWVDLYPSKTAMEPGETFYLTIKWYRTCYCPSDYFKILYRNEDTGVITEAGRHAEPYWTMCSSNCVEAHTQTLAAPTEPGTYTARAVHCAGHGEWWCGYYDVNWDCPRSDGGFIGHKPEEMTWDFYELADEFTITVTPLPLMIESFPAPGYVCPGDPREKDGDIDGDFSPDWFYEGISDDHEKSVELWGIDPWFWNNEYFALIFSGKYLIGKCPFGGGINGGFIKHVGDLDKNGKPDRFVEILYSSEDGGNDDVGKPIWPGFISVKGRDKLVFEFNVQRNELRVTHYDEAGNVIKSKVTPPSESIGSWVVDSEPIAELQYDEPMVTRSSIVTDFKPDTLNLKSKGEFITIYIELPSGYNVSQINISSLRLNDTIPPLEKPTEIGDYDTDGVPDIMVKFDRSSMIEFFKNSSVFGNSVIEITGMVTIPYVSFRGTDVIRLITPKIKK